MQPWIYDTWKYENINIVFLLIAQFGKEYVAVI
jgi:hypothetical protein